MNGNEQSILVRLISLFYPPQKTKTFIVNKC